MRWSCRRRFWGKSMMSYGQENKNLCTNLPKCTKIYMEGKRPSVEAGGTEFMPADLQSGVYTEEEV